MVVDPKGITVRGSPVYDKAEKLQRRVEEGEVVHVNQRRPAEGTTFLKISSPAGWLFDRQPNDKSQVRLMLVSVERGQWMYLVTAGQGIALRSRCSYSDSARIG